MSLRKKVFLILILLTSIPLIILGTMTNSIATSILEEKIAFLSRKTLENLTVYISRDVQSYMSLLFYCSRNSDIIETLTSNDSSRLTGNYYTIRKSIIQSDVVRQVSYPFQYIVLSGEGEMYTSFNVSPAGSYETTMGAITGQPWYKEMEKAPSRNHAIVLSDNLLFSKGDRQVYFASTIFGDFENLGVVLIGVDEYVFSRLIENSKITPGSSIFIFDDKGNVHIEGEQNPLSRTTADLEILASAQAANRSSSEHTEYVTIDTFRYVVTSDEIFFRDSSLSWQILMLTPMEEISRDVRKISYVYYLLLFVCLVAVAILSLLVNRVFIKPILTLSDITSRVSMGDLEVRAPESRGDEIGGLGRGFNRMIDSLKGYIASVEMEEANKRKLEIRILQNQIDPHFLRNSLNTIRWMAELKQAQGISRAIVSLSRLLDYNLSSDDTMATVAEELGYTEEYIHLQKLRYQNKFVFNLLIDDDLKRYKILRSTFQPIVENAIAHGFKGKKGRCAITLKGYESEGILVFKITDNGVGMEKCVMDRLFSQERQSAKESSEGIALINIQQRIKMNFGENYGLTIQSEYGEGTTVQIILPKITQDNGENPC